MTSLGLLTLLTLLSWWRKQQKLLRGYLDKRGSGIWNQVNKCNKTALKEFHNTQNSTFKTYL
nr:unnamed protein product [Callosobruchus chinensis]